MVFLPTKSKKKLLKKQRKLSINPDYLANDSRALSRFLRFRRKISETEELKTENQDSSNEIGDFTFIGFPNVFRPLKVNGVPWNASKRYNSKLVSFELNKPNPDICKGCPLRKGAIGAEHPQHRIECSQEQFYKKKFKGRIFIRIASDPSKWTYALGQFKQNASCAQNSDFNPMLVAKQIKLATRERMINSK